MEQDDEPYVEPFWKVKRLAEMTIAEWESLCDGCGRCCLVKLEDEDSGEVHLTRLACRLLDTGSCRCSDYAGRHAVVHDCIRIDAKKIRDLKWLPLTCAYRRLDEGRGLAWWHPLVSGTPDTVHEAGISVRGWARSETGVKLASYHRFIISGFDEE
ncbi:MAG: YcgN family cysteine cluster protein [Hyphomicrobium sp.]